MTVPLIWVTLCHLLSFLCVACQVFIQRDKQHLWNAEAVVKRLYGCFWFFWKIASTYFIFFDNWVAQSYPHTKTLCHLNKLVRNGERGRWYYYASKRILLTLRNILVCESLLFLDNPCVSLWFILSLFIRWFRGDARATLHTFNIGWPLQNLSF